MKFDWDRSPGCWEIKLDLEEKDSIIGFDGSDRDGCAGAYDCGDFFSQVIGDFGFSFHGYIIP